MLQTSGEVFAPLFWGIGTLMLMNIYSGTIEYVLNDMETLNHDDVWSYLWLYGYWDVEPTYVPWYIEEYFETLVVSGMVFGILMCGVFDVLDILKNLRVLDQEFANKPIIGR